MRICMLVKNSFEFDARVTREARSLVDAGHEVTVVALHVPGATPRVERRADGIRVVRVSRIYEPVRDLLPDFLTASTTTPGARADETPGGLPGHRAPKLASLPNGSRPRVFPLARHVLRRLVVMAAWPVLRLNDFVVGRRMHAAAVAGKPDVIHAHDLNTLAVGLRAAATVGARLIYDAHELHTARNDSTVVSRFVARVRERRGVRRADAVVTATKTWAAMMTEAYGIDPPAVVRNVPPRSTRVEPRDLRGRLNLAENATILLYQGSIQTNRGIEQTIEALRQLDDCVLVICGYGAHRPALEERVEAAGLTKRVRFDGPIPNDELVAYSAGADVGLCLIIGSSLSYRTSLPNKLFEYFMAGIPVIASDFPEMGAVVRDTDAGEVCDPTDPVAVVAAVRRLLHPQRYEVARRNARAAAGSLHWEAEKETLLAIYETLAPSRIGPGL